MKAITIYLFLATLHVYGQNAFVDGIHAAGKIDYLGDGSEAIFNNFKVDLDNEFSATYTYTYKWKEDKEENVYYYEVKWNWSDIITIKVDTDLYVVELNTAFKVVESSTYRANREKIVDDKASSVFIYFKSSGEAIAAADWAMVKVKESGGHAMLLD